MSPMRALTATELLGAWEQGVPQSAVERALTLLMLATDQAPERPAELSIGQRDAQLLALRERAFGPRMTGLAQCPACGLQMELDFTVDDVRVTPPSEPLDIGRLCIGDCEVSFRLPNSQHLAAIIPQGDVSSSKRALLERCLVSVRSQGKDIPAQDLSEEVVTAISQRMAEADPQADVQLALTCPQCGDRWLAPLDIAAFLWSEIHAWAVRLLREVHTLASIYGWRESEILALSPLRRRAYLELIDR